MKILALIIALAATWSSQTCIAQQGTTMPYGYFSSGDVPVPWRLKLHEKKWASVDSFTYVDNMGKRWVAPANTITDGASIPSIATWIVGMPTDYMRPALIHDAYCGVENEEEYPYARETWYDIHRMFYMACLADGKSCSAALLVYAALRVGGPREVKRASDKQEEKANKVAAKKAEKHIVAILRKANKDDATKALLTSFLDTTSVSGVAWNKMVTIMGGKMDDRNSWEYIAETAPMLKIRKAPAKLKRSRFMTVKDTLTKVSASTAPSCPMPDSFPQPFRGLDSALDKCRAKLFIDIWYYRKNELSFIKRLLS